MKQYGIKIYDLTGAYLATLPRGVRKNKLQFNSQINGGQGELIIDTNIDFENPPAYLEMMNFVRVYMYDDDVNQEGLLVYSGFISRTQFYANGSITGTRITCLGLVSLLALSLHTTAGDYPTVPYTNKDPKEIIDNVLVRHQVSFPCTFGDGWIGSDAIADIRSGGNIDTVGTLVTFEFASVLWKEAIQKAVDLAGSTWYWFIDKGGDVFFKNKGVTVDHTFTLGKDCDSLDIKNDSEQIVNYVTVAYNGGRETSSDATSIASFGKRFQFFDESSNTSSATTAKQIADQKLAEGKDYKYSGTLKINDLYDLESIRPGQTCRIRNLRNQTSIVSDNMQIVSVSYSEDAVTLTLEDDMNFGLVLANFLNSQKKIRNLAE